MRKICLINVNNGSSDSLNLFANIARKGKRVLIIDLKLFSTRFKSKVGLNIANCICEKLNPEKYVTNLERNLDIIKGNIDLNFEEFNCFNEFFKLDYFEKEFKKLNYDYIVFDVSAVLNVLTLNALMYCKEIIILSEMNNYEIEFTHKMSKFIETFNNTYSRKIFISKIIPMFNKKLSSKHYTYLVSNFSSRIISFPFNKNKKNNEFKLSLNNISSSIIDDEKYFDLNTNSKEKQKIINEYLDILNENSRVEIPLTKF